MLPMAPTSTCSARKPAVPCGIDCGTIDSEESGCELSIESIIFVKGILPVNDADTFTDLGGMGVAPVNLMGFIRLVRRSCPTASWGGTLGSCCSVTGMTGQGDMLLGMAACWG